MEILSERWHHEYRRKRLHFPEIEWRCGVVKPQSGLQGDSIKFKSKTKSINLIRKQFAKYHTFHFVSFIIKNFIDTAVRTKILTF